MDLAITNISSLYTINSDLPGAQGKLGRLENVSIGFKDGKVCYIGNEPSDVQADCVIDGHGLVGLPGLVDCHTHSVWAGSRSDEFARRLEGETYISILESGGGILSTVTNTRKASTDELARDCRQRVLRMRNESGVTTVEIKSGYGLTADDELKMLRAASQATDGQMRCVKTFLGAHTIPKDQRDNREGYVKDVIENQLPACKDIADCVDVFCDRGAFTIDEARRILQAGKDCGLVVRAHAEQIEQTGCAKLVAELGGTSADHLEHLDDEGIKAMAENDVVAVMLPGAQLYLKDPSPPVVKLRNANVKLAVATDLNPGSSPVHSLWTTATLACITQGLTIDEAVLGITRNAGLALGRKDLGWLCDKGASVGDLVLFATPPGEPVAVEGMIQQMACQTVKLVVIDGKVVVDNLTPAEELPGKKARTE